MANKVSLVTSSKELSSQLVQWRDGGPDERLNEDYGEDEKEFEENVCQTVSVLNVSSSFLLNLGTNVQNLLVSHLEKVTTILDLMQRRKHNRSKSVVLTLAVLLQTMDGWTSEDQVLCNFFLDRKRDADYFLQHANALRLRLGPYRLPDFLVTLCLSCRSGPELLRSALRYGLSPDTRTQNFRHSWDGVVLTSDLQTTLLVHYGKMAEEDNEDVDTFGRLLMEALTPGCVDARTVELDLASCHLVQLFLQLTGRDVPSLKRLCRAKIRAKLHANWALPHGVQRLDLPLDLKSYLDVEN